MIDNLLKLLSSLLFSSEVQEELPAPANPPVVFLSFVTVSNGENFLFTLSGGRPANYYIYEVINGVTCTDYCLYISIQWHEAVPKIHRVLLGGSIIGEPGRNSVYAGRKLGSRLVICLLNEFPGVRFFMGAAGELSDDGLRLLNYLHANHPENVLVLFQNEIDATGGLILTSNQLSLERE